MLSKDWAPGLPGDAQTPNRLDRLSKAETGGGAKRPNERPFGCSAAPQRMDCADRLEPYTSLYDPD